MLAEDFDKIIMVSSKHVTKHDFYESKRAEFGCLPLEYANALMDSYVRLENFLKIIDHSIISLWWPKGPPDGRSEEVEIEEEEAISSQKRFYDLFKETGGKFEGRFELQDLQKLKQDIFSYCSEILGKDRPTGFYSKFTESKQKEDLYYKMKGKYIDAELTNFIAILTNETVPIGFDRVKWVRKWGKNPHKTSLREFLELVVIAPDVPLNNERVNALISDEKNNNIVLANQQATTSPDKYEIEQWIKEIMHNEKNKIHGS
jgi:hypothetical protein